MQTVEALRRKIGSAEELLAVVKTMKALAAVNIRHYERAVASLMEYDRTVEMGLHIVLRAQNGRRVTARSATGQQGQLGALIFGSDQGLCGQFNERIVNYAVNEMSLMPDTQPGHRLLAVGERAAGLLSEAGEAVTAVFNVPSGLAGITPTVQDLLLTIEEWRQLGMDEIVLFHNRPLSGSTYYPQMVRLLPVDLHWLRSLQAAPWESRVLPMFSMPWDDLFSRLVRHHMFVALYRACAESLASEDTSRLVSMQTAERNIEERLAELNQRYHHLRQNNITAELLDIVSGFEATTGGALYT